MRPQHYRHIRACLLAIVTLCSWSSNTHAQLGSSSKYAACIQYADNYYEQIYCEIKAKGEGRSLPTLSDFKNNNEQMQALLLKRKAMSLKIPFKMPTTQAAQTNQQKVEVQPEASQNQDCKYQQRSIQCAEGVYTLIGNKPNTKLRQGALADDNKIALQAFKGNISDKALLVDYLTKSYARYIQKMIDIGLAGATMSFNKFYYLFQDLHSKGVNFTQRFETMFHYLKLDKKSLGVTEQIDAIEGLSLKHCYRLSTDLFTCDNSRSNRVYVRGTAN